MTDQKRTSVIRAAGIVSLSGNIVLAAIKITVAVFTGSLALLGDGLDTVIDVAISLMTIIVSGIIARPGDKEHPWGHGRAETVATIALSFVIFFAGAQLVLQAVSRLAKGGSQNEVGSLALVAAAVSIFGKSILAAAQMAMAKKSGSAMIMANAKNMRGDIVMSAGTLAGIAASKIFHCPKLDSITATLVGAWVMRDAIGIFLETNTELMDGNTNSLVYKRMFDAVMGVRGVSNPHRARIRKLSSRWDVDLDIEVDPNLSVHDAHEIANSVERAIHEAIPDVYDIMVHVEPAGHDEHHSAEQFGLRESDVDTPQEMAEHEKTREAFVEGEQANRGAHSAKSL